MKDTTLLAFLCLEVLLGAKELMRYHLEVLALQLVRAALAEGIHVTEEFLPSKKF